jgi:chemotaxis protein CheD
MFSFSNNSDYMRIGERNVKATIEALEKAKVPLLAKDTGKNYGRSIRFCTQTGELYIKTIIYGEKII